MTDEPTRAPNDDERVSRLSAAVSRSDDDDILREYENRYAPARKTTPLPRSYSTMNVSDDERLWANISLGREAEATPTS